MCLNITSEQHDGILIMRLSGRFDVLHAPEVSQRLTAAGTDDGLQVVIDLAQVTFIDTAALAMLVKLLKTVRATGGDIKLAALPGSVKLIFELTRLDRAFPVYDTVQDALTAYQGDDDDA
jgi:anti-sigma B factor antagonist